MSGGGSFGAPAAAFGSPGLVPVACGLAISKMATGSAPIAPTMPSPAAAATLPSVAAPAATTGVVRAPASSSAVFCFSRAPFSTPPAAATSGAPAAASKARAPAPAPFSFSAAACPAPACVPFRFSDPALAGIFSKAPAVLHGATASAPFSFRAAACPAPASVPFSFAGTSSSASAVLPGATAPGASTQTMKPCTGAAASTAPFQPFAAVDAATVPAAAPPPAANDADKPRAKVTMVPSFVKQLNIKEEDNLKKRSKAHGATPANHFGRFAFVSPVGTPAGSPTAAPRFDIGQDPTPSPKPATARAGSSPPAPASPFRFGVATTGNEDIDAILQSLQLISDTARRLSTIGASSSLGAAVAVVGKLAARTLDFTRALEQEAIRLQAALADEQHCAAQVHTAFAAVRSQALAATSHASALHPLVTDNLMPLDSLSNLDRIPGMAEQQQERVRKAEEALRSLDFHKLHEDRWQEQARERDDGRQSFIHLQQMRMAGLRAKQQWIERQLELEPGPEGAASAGAHGEAKTTVQAGAAAPPAATSSDGQKDMSPITDVPGPWRQMLTSLEFTARLSTEACGGISRMVRQVSDEQRGRWAALRMELLQNRQSIEAAECSLRIPSKLHQRRRLGEARLDELKQVKAQLDAVRREVVGARHQAEIFELIALPGDRRLAELRAEHHRCQAVQEDLRSRCAVLVTLMTELSQWPPSARSAPAEGASGACIFPEMPARAHRILDPVSAREELSPGDQARFDIELLLRRSGLLVYNQSYEASFKDISSIVPGKPNVKKATVRGSASERVKVLKEYSLADFRSIERSIVTSRWLSHPGVVPVECAFVERCDVVVVQMPWFCGGNMREWCRRHRGDMDARVRAAAKVSEAVRYLHANDVMHRDLKPENVVVDGVGADATPALCDFDLSVSQASVGVTRVRGTLLYLAPDNTPSKASDVFSLGMLLLDVLFCAGDDTKLSSWLGHAGRFGIDEPSLERLCLDLRRTTAADPEVAACLGAVNEGIPHLIGEMIRSDCRERPTAAAVAARLCEILDLRVCSLCFTDCAPAQVGIECAHGHYTCQHCFSRHVCFPESLCTGGEAGRSSVKCGMAYGKDPCKATFTLQQTAKCVTSPAFETLRRNADDLRLVEVQREFERWKVEHEEAQAKRSEMERRVLASRQRIEELQSDRCPRCERVFIDFEGCAALTCGYADCGAAFCAFCGEDCGDDSHVHVRRCRLNPRRDEYYVDRTTWATIRRAERIVNVRAYWAELSKGVRAQLFRDANVPNIMRELGLHAELAQAAE